MRLLVLSDLHLEHQSFSLAMRGFDVVVLAGDVCTPGRDAIEWVKKSAPNDVSAIVVAGNHEYHDTSIDDEKSAMYGSSRSSNVHFLDCTSIVLGGVRFLGCTLWTDFQLPIEIDDGTRRVSDQRMGMQCCSLVLDDYVLIRVGRGLKKRPLRPEDTLEMHLRERHWLLSELQVPFDGPTVVVTHHAPHRLSLAKTFRRDWASTAFVSDLDEIYFKTPALWIHGHTHSSFDYSVGNCRVLCNPRGYAKRSGASENGQFQCDLVVELDAHGRCRTLREVQR